MTGLSRVLLLQLLLVLLFSTLSSTVSASDDSNTGIITPIPTNSSHSPSSNATKTLEAIDKLTQGSNNTLPQSMIDQLKKDVQTGNNTDAAQTIRKLQSYVTSSNGTGISLTLKDLVQSLKVESNGVSVDSNILNSLLGDPNQQGVPEHLTEMDPARVANDLSTLSNLLRGIDPSTALSLARDSRQIQDLLQGLNGSSPGTVTIPPQPSPPPINVPGSGGGELTAKLPPVSPSIGTGFQLGGINPIFIILFIAAIIGAALIMIRRSPFSFNAPQTNRLSSRDSESMEKPEMSLNLGSARDLVVYYFRRTVAAMGKKGVQKLHFETHREFSAKCTPMPEAKPVGHVSSIYEKAMFSGREVTHTDIDEARENTLSVEGPSRSGSKDPVKPTSNA